MRARARTRARTASTSTMVSGLGTGFEVTSLTSMPVMGCYWNMPANYDAGVFESCEGENDLPMGVYGTSTWFVPRSLLCPGITC